jgi:hypothetical protein
MEKQENTNNKKMGNQKTPEDNLNIDQVTNEDLEGMIINRQQVTIVIN